MRPPEACGHFAVSKIVHESGLPPRAQRYEPTEVSGFNPLHRPWLIETIWA
jgi:hypothetical protein